MPKHPVQPLIKDKHKVVRFKANPIVRFLLDSNPRVDMNMLARMDFSKEDRQQFAQLIGYSLAGYSELGYVTDGAWKKASSQTIYPVKA